MLPNWKRKMYRTTYKKFQISLLKCLFFKLKSNSKTTRLSYQFVKFSRSNHIIPTIYMTNNKISHHWRSEKVKHLISNLFVHSSSLINFDCRRKYFVSYIIRCITYRCEQKNYTTHYTLSPISLNEYRTKDKAR